MTGSQHNMPAHDVSTKHMPPRIVCVGASPSLDRTLVVDNISFGEVNRSSKVFVEPGGKAANVAKVVAALGGAPILVGPVGGGTGAEIRRLAESTGLDCRWAESLLPTRICTAIVGSKTSDEAGGSGGTVTDFNEPGAVDGKGWAEFLGIVSEVTASHSERSRVLLSGSLPAVAERQAADLMIELAGSIAPAAELWVDTSWASLREIVDGDRAVALLKINLSEALEYLGQDWERSTFLTSDHHGGVRPVRPHDRVMGFLAAGELAGRIDGSAAVTLGHDGAVLSDGQDLWWGKVDAPQVLNPTGSGDSFFAGLAMGWEQGPIEALRLALACGASNAAHLPAGVIDPSSVADLTRKAVVVQGPRPA